MKLTEKQKRFCDFFVKLGNATEAAIRAGYSKKTASVIGNENLNKPYIQDYIQERLQQKEKARVASADEILEFLSDTLRSPFAERKDRIRAAELLGKRCLLWQDNRKAEAGIRKTEAEVELIRERTKILKGASKDTRLLEAFIEVEKKYG